MKSKKLAALVLICLFSVTFITSCNESKKDSTTETAGVAADTEFDLVILNGRVIDPETNFDGIRNVGVQRWQNCLNHRRVYFWKRNCRCNR